MGRFRVGGGADWGWGWGRRMGVFLTSYANNTWQYRDPPSQKQHCIVECYHLHMKNSTQKNWDSTERWSGEAATRCRVYINSNATICILMLLCRGSLGLSRSLNIHMFIFQITGRTSDSRCEDWRFEPWVWRFICYSVTLMILNNYLGQGYFNNTKQWLITVWFWH